MESIGALWGGCFVQDLQQTVVKLSKHIRTLLSKSGTFVTVTDW